MSLFSAIFSAVPRAGVIATARTKRPLRAVPRRNVILLLHFDSRLGLGPISLVAAEPSISRATQHASSPVSGTRPARRPSARFLPGHRGKLPPYGLFGMLVQLRNTDFEPGLYCH